MERLTVKSGETTFNFTRTEPGLAHYTADDGRIVTKGFFKYENNRLWVSDDVAGDDNFAPVDSDPRIVNFLLTGRDNGAK